MLHTISNKHLSVAVSGKGAELQSILRSDGTEYLWQGDPKYWSDRSLTIFPYVARLTNGQYELDGKHYPMKIHGIAMYETFSLSDQTEDRLVFELSDTPEIYANYPRHFLFRVTYSLHGNTLNTTYRVENRDSKSLYFGLGGHPGFNVPLLPETKFDDYSLRFSEPCNPVRVGFTENCFLDGTSSPYPLKQHQVLPLSHNLFDQDAIVLTDLPDQVTLELNGAACLSVRYTGFPYLGIWHAPHTDAPYVCIEPWSSLPSTQDQIAVLEEQPDLLTLTPGQIYEISWQIIIGKDERNETF